MMSIANMRQQQQPRGGRGRRKRAMGDTHTHTHTQSERFESRSTRLSNKRTGHSDYVIFYIICMHKSRDS